MSLLREICNIAEDKNIDQLKTILAQHEVCIGFTENFETPVMRLAQQGKYEAVDFLLNAFNANPNDALVGYAKNDDAPHVNALLDQGFSSKYAILGYALNGNQEQVNALKNNNDYLDVEAAVKGYAHGGFIDNVNHIIDTRPNTKEKYICQRTAILYYATAGNTSEVNKLLAEHKNNPKDLSTLHNFAISGYAQGGHTIKANELLGIEQWNPTDVAAAAKSYAHANNIEQATILINKLNKDVSVLMMAIKGFARSGNTKQVDALCAHYPQHATKCTIGAIMGYAQGRHIEKVDDLVTNLDYVNIALHCYTEAGFMDNFEDLLQIITQTSKPELKNKIALSAPVHLATTVLQESTNLLQLIEKHGGHYFNARAELKSAANIDSKNFLFIPEANINEQEKNLTITQKELQALFEKHTRRFRINHFLAIEQPSYSVTQVKSLRNWIYSHNDEDIISLNHIRNIVRTTDVSTQNNGFDFSIRKLTNAMFTALNQKFIDSALTLKSNLTETDTFSLTLSTR